MVILSIPVALVVSCLIHIVFLINRIVHVIHSRVDIVIQTIFLVKFLEASRSAQMRPSIMLVPMVFVLLQEIFIAFIVFKSIAYVLLMALSL